jgi:hypothetical protein
MPLSDSSQTYMRAVWPKPSPAVLRLTFVAGVCEVSRFSCMKFLGVSGVFDYAGLSRSSRYRACSCCLPCITKTSASGLHLFGAEYHPAYPLSTLHWVPRSSSARLDAETDRYSFLVRLLYPLLHAGLPRCTIIGIVSPTTMMVGFRPNCGFLGSVSMDRVPSLISMM